MRKQVIRVPQGAPAWDESWLDLDKAAWVEVTAEDENYPIESASWQTRREAPSSFWPSSSLLLMLRQSWYDNPQSSRRNGNLHRCLAHVFAIGVNVDGLLCFDAQAFSLEIFHAGNGEVASEINRWEQGE